MVNKTELLFIKNEIEKVRVRGKNRGRNTQLNRKKRMNVGTNPNKNLFKGGKPNPLDPA